MGPNPTPPPRRRRGATPAPAPAPAPHTLPHTRPVHTAGGGGGAPGPKLAHGARCTPACSPPRPPACTPAPAAHTGFPARTVRAPGRGTGRPPRASCPLAAAPALGWPAGAGCRLPGCPALQGGLTGRPAGPPPPARNGPQPRSRSRRKASRTHLLSIVSRSCGLQAECRSGMTFHASAPPVAGRDKTHTPAACEKRTTKHMKQKAGQAENLSCPSKGATGHCGLGLEGPAPVLRRLQPE